MGVVNCYLREYAIQRNRLIGATVLPLTSSFEKKLAAHQRVAIYLLTDQPQKNGLMVLPVEYAANWSEAQWYTLG